MPLFIFSGLFDNLIEVKKTNKYLTANRVINSKSVAITDLPKKKGISITTSGMKIKKDIFKENSHKFLFFKESKSPL
jgi:ribosomal protein S12